MKYSSTPFIILRTNNTGVKPVLNFMFLFKVKLIQAMLDRVGFLSFFSNWKSSLELNKRVIKLNAHAHFVFKF